MIELHCDKCGKRVMSSFAVSVQEVKNPYPSHFDDMVQSASIFTQEHKTFMLCGDCYHEMGLPNIYYPVEEFAKRLKEGKVDE